MKSFVFTARKSVLAAASIAVAGFLCTQHLHADDKMMDDKMTMTADDHTAVSDQMNHMKTMAADSSNIDKMATDMAKMMVMDHMAATIAADPTFKQQCMESMNDANMKTIHEKAMAMAKDPDQMMKLKAEIMADGQAMKMIMHRAAVMNMRDKMDDKIRDQK